MSCRNWIVILAFVMTPRVASAQTDTILPGQPDHGRPDRDPRTDQDHGLSAPLVEVDRFSDAAGTRFRRSADPTLPAPNVPFSLDDARFSLQVVSPDGLKAKCYDLDARPAKPNRLYVFYDTRNNFRLGQFPVIDSIPGDPGYSDLWDIWKVYTPDTFYETNWVRDAKTVESLLADKSSGFSGQSTGVYLNAPIVPEGTTASLKAEGRPGGPTTRYFAWYRGKRAPYLYLEGSLHLTPEGTIPVAEMKIDEGAGQVKTWPKGPGYSPLVRVVDSSGKVTIPTLNCPVVGTASVASP